VISLKKIILASTAIMSSALIIPGYLFYDYTQQKIKSESVELSGAEVFQLKEALQPQPVWEGYKGEFTMLVIGSDERDGTTNDKNSSILNDVMLLVHVVEDQSRASVLSIPRDLLANFETCSGNSEDIRQINSALSYGGVDCVVSVVSDLTDLDIPHAVLVNFASVVNITEIIDGVPVCLPSPLIHHGTREEIAPQGDSVLKGINALDFVRERKTIQGGGDFGRISNQQVFIKNMLLKINKEGTLTSPSKLISLATEVLENVKVSSTLTDLTKLARLGFMLRDIGVDNIDFYISPVRAAPQNPNRLALKEKEWSALLSEMQSPKIVPEAADDSVSTSPSLSSKTEGSNVEEPNNSKEVEAEIKNSEGYYCGLGSGY
jgi:LCP family protein required for cell wall assembly